MTNRPRFWLLLTTAMALLCAPAWRLEPRIPELCYLSVVLAVLAVIGWVVWIRKS